MNIIFYVILASWFIHLPSFWAGNSENIWNINQEDWNYIANLENIEKDDYWDFGNDFVENNAEYVDSTGKVWTLHHDGDLFAVALDSMTEQEKNKFFEDY